MNKKLAQIVGAAAFLMATTHSAQATTYQDVTLGGVNLSAWCQKAYGEPFKARLFQKNAGGWKCEVSAGDNRPIFVRPISVKSACKLQYGSRAYKAKALNWNDPYSWKCFARKAVPTMRGVNLTPWCKKTFGSAFKAKLIQHNAGGWTCQQSAGDRRPISVTSACKLQYGKKAIKAKALNWQDPYSWKCILR